MRIHQVQSNARSCRGMSVPSSVTRQPQPSDRPFAGSHAQLDQGTVQAPLGADDGKA